MKKGNFVCWHDVHCGPSERREHPLLEDCCPQQGPSPGAKTPVASICGTGIIEEEGERKRQVDAPWRLILWDSEELQETSGDRVYVAAGFRAYL